MKMKMELQSRSKYLAKSKKIKQVMIRPNCFYLGFVPKIDYCRGDWTLIRSQPRFKIMLLFPIISNSWCNSYEKFFYTRNQIPLYLG